jgi:hypothetical protein
VRFRKTLILPTADRLSTCFRKTLNFAIFDLKCPDPGLRPQRCRLEAHFSTIRSGSERASMSRSLLAVWASLRSTFAAFVGHSGSSWIPSFRLA